MAKDKFAELDADFKTEIANMDEDEIRSRISMIALNQVELEKAMSEDQDLSEKKTQAKVAGEGYKDGTKHNKLRIRFCKQVLEDMGKEAGSFE